MSDLKVKRVNESFLRIFMAELGMHDKQFFFIDDLLDKIGDYKRK